MGQKRTTLPENENHGIPCPSCGQRHVRISSEIKQITDSRPARDSVRRRRICICGHRYTTYESLHDPKKFNFQLRDKALHDIDRILDQLDNLRSELFGE